MLRRAFVAGVLALAVAGPAGAQTAPNPSFYLLNRSDIGITEVYATPTGLPNWGRNRLTEGSVPPGQSYPIRLLADGNCVYDVKVVYANGRAEERRALNTCNVDNVSFPSGQRAGRTTAPASSSNDPSFRVVNRSRSKVNEVYASLSGDDSWGEDRLGEETVAPGASHTIQLPNGECVYDVRIVFANGEATEKRRLNLCNITDLRVP